MSHSASVVLRILCSMMIAFVLLLLKEIPFIEPFWLGMTVILFVGFSIYIESRSWAIWSKQAFGRR